MADADGRRLCAAALCLALVACSPSLNWREAALDGVPVRALLPCKPDRTQLAVPALQADGALRLMGCEADGMAFVVGALRVAPGDGAPALLTRWRDGAWRSLGVEVPSAGLAPAGWTRSDARMTGAAWAEQWQGQGHDSTSRPVQARMMYAHGAGWAVQAAIYGAQVTHEAWQPLTESLRLEAKVAP